MNDEAQSADNETSQVSGGKGSGLTGGALTDEALDSSDGVLREAGTFGRKGLQQWYTPPDVARFIADVIGNLAAPALDLTAGDGALLEPWNYCYGIELDSDQIKSAEAKHRTYDAINGDVQRVFPLLHALKVEFPIIVINPPFGLDWRDEMLAPKGASSTLLTFKYAINRLARPGLGALICGRDRYDREIAALTADDPAGRKVFLRINVLDNLFDEPVALPCTIAFFSHETCEVPLTLDLPRSLLAVTGPGLRQHASVAPYVNKRVAYVSPWELSSTWDTVREEHKYGAEVRALGRPDHTVSIAGGKLKVYLRPVLKAAFDWQNINWIESLDGQSPNIFALNRRDWRRLCELRDQYANVGFDIEPSCEGKIQQAIADAARLTSPLYPIRPQQRLAYLDDVTRIKCIKTPKDAPTKRAVVEGKEYGVETRSRVMQRVVTKLDVSETTGETKQTRAERTFKILEIILTDLDTQRSFTFKESDEDINFLIEHFDVPHVGDVKETAPEEYERALRLVKSVEDEDLVPRGLALKNFQREDLARLLTKGGGCLAWEQGLGKTVAAMTFCEAVQNDDAEELALFIVPQDLVPQWQREAFRFYGRTLRVVGTVSDAITLAEDIKAGWRGWAITWFEALSRNGRANESVPHPAPVGLYARDLRFFEDQERKIKRNGRTKTVKVKVPCAPTPVDDSPPMLVSEWRESTKRHIPGGWGNYQDENGEWQYGYIPPKTETEVVPQTTKTHCPECRGTYAIGYSPATGRCKRPIHGEKHNDKVGKRRGSEKRVCGYTPTTLRLKPAYSFLLTAFRNGTIVIDEGTKIKGDTSLMSLSVRGLKAKYRILLTGTPIKNYITSAFWLLWWALGNNTVRFPYNYVGGSEKWAKDFAVIEQEFKQDKKGREHAGSKKVLPEISNVLVLWRLLSSSIIRRRMEDCGEEVQPIAYKPTEVPFGVKQLKMYRNWLDGDNFARYFLAKHPDCAIPPNMVAKMGALLGQNWKLEFATCLPEGELDQVDRYRAGATNWTPKNTLALELAMEHAAKGDKVLIGSPLMAHGPWLAHQLNLAGVYALHIVEESGELKTIGPRKRADVVKDFVDNGAQVLCAGVHALNLGHNLEVANVVILTGFPWDMSTLDQFVKRVRRITSKKPITVYPLMVKDTIDTRKWELLTNEIASSDLALDGFLRFKHEEPPSMQEVLNELMEKGIQATGDEIDEDSCKARWETFVKRFRTEHPELAPPEEPPLPWRTLLDADAEEVADGVLSLGDPPAVPLDFEHVEDVYYTGRGRTWTVYVDEEDGGTYLMDLELFLAGETETCEVSVLQ